MILSQATHNGHMNPRTAQECQLPMVNHRHHQTGEMLRKLL